MSARLFVPHLSPPPYARPFIPHLIPPPYMGKEDAATCEFGDGMRQRLLPPSKRGKAGMGGSAQRRSFVPHLSPPPYMGEEDAATCKFGDGMRQRLLPPSKRGKAGMGGSAQRRSFVPHLGPPICEVVCPPPQSSPINGGGRCCNLRIR